MTWLGDLGSTILGGLYAFRIPVALAGVVIASGLLLVARRRGWFARARRHPRATAVVLVPLLAFALPVGWYLTSPLVLSATIDEARPVVAVAPSAPSGAPSSADAKPSPAASAGPGTSATAGPLLELSGSFHGSDDFHFGRGTARLIETAPGTFVVRLEEFAVRNGPDLYVYLSPSADGFAAGAIELGRLKADQGNQNYAVPAGTLSDPASVGSVVIWCKQFSHLFATAPLAP
jgi:hypothetical protein